MSYRRATNIVEESTKNSDQISAIHLTALLRLSELISRDPKKAQEAHRLHQRVLSLKSDFKPAFETWTKVLSASNRRVETAVMLAKALEYESSDPDILYNVSFHSMYSSMINFNKSMTNKLITLIIVHVVSFVSALVYLFEAKHNFKINVY